MKTEKQLYGKETKRSSNNRLRQSPEGGRNDGRPSSHGRNDIRRKGSRGSSPLQTHTERRREEAVRKRGNGKETNLSRDGRRVSQEDNNRLTEHQQRVAKHVDEPLQTDLEII